MNHKALGQWLAAEDGGSDDAAEAAFAHLFAAVPRVQASPAFAQEAVHAARQWRARRRWLMFAAAAAILLVVSGSLVGYGLAPQIARSMIKGLAFVSSRGVPWLVAYTTVAVDWWWMLGRVGGTLTTALITPARLVAIVGVELVGLLALYALRRAAGAGHIGDAQA